MGRKPLSEKGVRSSRPTMNRVFSIYRDQYDYWKKYLKKDINISASIRDIFDRKLIPQEVHPSLSIEVHKLFVLHLSSLVQIKDPYEQAVYLYTIMTKYGLTVTVWQMYCYIQEHQELLK
jgi:hypothetical protein